MPVARQTVWGLVAGVSCWILAFCLACVLADPESQADDYDALSQLLGESRSLLGRGFYEQADRYFHRGVGHVHETAFADFFVQWAEHITPHTHEHTHGKEMAEILPWLRFTTRVDPEHVEPWLVSSFWMADELGQIDRAHAIIDEALRTHRGDYRLYTERGRLFLKQRKPAEAARALDTALRQWSPEAADGDKEQASLDAAKIRSYRGFLHEWAGETNAAIAAYEQSLSLRPDQKALRDRVQALRAGVDRRAWLDEAWDSLFVAPNPMQDCGHEHH